MLVDNAVVGDSRVTKAARSAMDAGYDVVMIGASGNPRDITVGGVPVLLRPGRVVPRGPGAVQRAVGLAGYGDASAQRAAATREAERRARSKRRITRVKRAGARRGGIWRVAAKGATAGLATGNVALRRLSDARAHVSRYATAPRPPVQPHWPSRLEDRVPRLMARTSLWEHLDAAPARFQDGWLPLILELKPDLIHANDYRTLPAAIAAKRAILAAGGDVKVVYDAHEYVQAFEELGPVRHEAAKRLERSLIREADAVVTVSEPIADLLQESYRLARRPSVVLNAPEASPGRTPGPTLRERVGVDDDTPLLVYSGSVGRARALDMCVDALRLLPGVHLALVVGAPNSGVMEDLVAQATRAGVRDRLHLTRYVPQEYIVDFVGTATAGLIPFKRNPNNENSLPTKAREYLVAGIPQVVSDVRELSRFVTEHGIGEVHTAEDVESFADAVRRVMADPGRYRRGMTDELRAQHSWSTQAPILTGVYAGLLGEARAAAGPRDVAACGDPAPVDRPPAEPILPAAGDEPCRLIVGPSNSAGQGWAWAQAASTFLEGVGSTTVVIDHGNHLAFDADRLISTAERTDPAWIARFDAEVAASRTHVLLESGVTLSGSAIEPAVVAEEVGLFEAAGLTVGLALHGSEVRDPARHMERYAWSAFHDADPAWRATLQQRVATTRPLAEWLGVPTFVSTLDLLDDVPWATWLPVTIDVDRYATDRAPFERRVPVVVHAPSQAALKGTQHIDPVLQGLAGEGLIEYRPLSGIAARDMAGHVKDADVIVDQLGLGLYGALSCEGMAAGRLVMAQVGDAIRRRLPGPLPVVEISADTLEARLRELLADRDQAREVALAGPAFVREHHDGRAAARVLATFLGRPALHSERLSQASPRRPERASLDQ